MRSATQLYCKTVEYGFPIPNEHDMGLNSY